MIDWLFRRPHHRSSDRRPATERPPARLPGGARGPLDRPARRGVGSGVAGVGAAGLVVWSGDEIVRGVNPWRRLLGGGVLAASLVGVLTR